MHKIRSKASRVGPIWSFLFKSELLFLQITEFQLYIVMYLQLSKSPYENPIHLDQVTFLGIKLQLVFVRD